mgnify:CR=1 FL=1
MNHQNKELKKAGLKATLPRVKIMEVLESTVIQEEAHFSAEDIYKELLSSCLLYTSPSPRDLP